MKAIFRSLAIRNYRIWFLGALVSNIGLWMQRTAQDWIVLTHLTQYDALAVGITMSLQLGPQLFLVPLSGLLSDRFDRRRILVATSTAAGALSIALGILVLSGRVELWHVYAIALAGGIVTAIENPAKQGFVAELVQRERLANAVSLNAASFNLARTAGPSIAALAIVVLGPTPVFFITAASCAVMVTAIRLLDRGALVAGTRLESARGNLWSGFSYVRRRADVMVLFAAILLVGSFGLNFPIFTSTMATLDLKMGAVVYGALMSAVAVGAVTGALLSARRDEPRLSVMALGVTCLGLALLLTAVMPEFWSMAVAFAIAGFGAQTALTTANAYVQLTISSEMRGRIMALYMAILVGGTPIGAPFIGSITNLLGPRTGLAAGAAGVLLGAGALGLHLFRVDGPGRAERRAIRRAKPAPELGASESLEL